MPRSTSVFHRDYEVTLPPQSVPFHVLHEAVQREAMSREILEEEGRFSEGYTKEQQNNYAPHDPLSYAKGVQEENPPKNDMNGFLENQRVPSPVIRQNTQQVTPRESFEHQDHHFNELKHQHRKLSPIVNNSSLQSSHSRESIPQGSRISNYPRSTHPLKPPKTSYNNERLDQQSSEYLRRRNVRSYTTEDENFRPCRKNPDERIDHYRECSNHSMNYHDSVVNMDNDSYSPPSRPPRHAHRHLQQSSEHPSTNMHRLKGKSRPQRKDHLIDHPLYPCPSSSTLATDSTGPTDSRGHLFSKRYPTYDSHHQPEGMHCRCASPRESPDHDEYTMKPSCIQDEIPLRSRMENQLRRKECDYIGAQWRKKGYLYSATPYKYIGTQSTAEDIHREESYPVHKPSTTPFYKPEFHNFRSGFSYATNNSGVVPSYVAIVSHPLVDSYGLLEYILEDEKFIQGPLMGVEFISTQKVNDVDPKYLRNISSCRRIFERLVRQSSAPALIIDGFFNTLDLCKMVLTTLGPPQLILILTMPHRHVFKQMSTIKKCNTEENLDQISQSVFHFDHTLPDIVSHLKSKASIKNIEFTKQPLIPLATEVKNILFQFLVRAG